MENKEKGILETKLQLGTPPETQRCAWSPQTRNVRNRGEKVTKGETETKDRKIRKYLFNA